MTDYFLNKGYTQEQITQAFLDAWNMDTSELKEMIDSPLADELHRETCKKVLEIFTYWKTGSGVTSTTKEN